MYSNKEVFLLNNKKTQITYLSNTTIQAETSQYFSSGNCDPVWKPVYTYSSIF